jgi:hypothetical protein
MWLGPRKCIAKKGWGAKMLVEISRRLTRMKIKMIILQRNLPLN